MRMDVFGPIHWNADAIKKADFRQVHSLMSLYFDSRFLQGCFLLRVRWRRKRCYWRPGWMVELLCRSLRDCTQWKAAAKATNK